MNTKRMLTEAAGLARERLGFESLRPDQEEALTSVCEGKDTLLVLPTGGGKSAVYQLASMVLPGPTVVISPLISLQRDQVQSIDDANLGEAALVNSHESKKARTKTLESADELDFLFMAPEQFGAEDTLERLHEARPSLFVVDEAHCISEWGDSFRPDYLRLGTVIEELGHPTVLALTATASPPVRNEIVERLQMRDPVVIVHGFDRPNIWLGVERYHDEDVKQRELLQRVKAEELPGIVYAATRKHTEEVAEALAGEGLKAAAYHAGLKASEREEIQDAFMDDRLDIVVATSAFGMGIDKPNVRFVYHYDVPESVDLYYQEIGRAGRDGQPARAVLFYRPEDLGIHQFFAGGGKVNEEQMETVIEAISAEDEPIDTAELKESTELSNAKLTTAINRLEEVGAIEVLSTGEIVEAEYDEEPAEVVAEAIEAEDHRRQADRSRIEMMRGYAEVGNCRREYLLNYFGENYEPPCDNCDNCEAGVVVENNDRLPFPLHARVRHSTFGEGLVERYDGDTMIVLFDDVGYKNLLVDFVQETGALTLADAGEAR
jgi:ATP-dependent DNA helicase RecQ